MALVRLLRILLLAHVLVGTAHHAAALPRREQPGAQSSAFLRHAEIEVRVESPTRATVTASLTMRDGDAAFDLLWTLFPGQRIEPTASESDSELVLEIPAGSRIRRTMVPANRGRTRVRLAYVVETGGAWPYRFPLPVPEVASDPSASSVSLGVRLPPGSHFQGDSFPRLVRATGTAGYEVLSSSPVSVPAFVHVVFSDRPRGFGRHRVIEVTSIGGGLLLLLFLFVRARRARAARANVGSDATS